MKVKDTHIDLLVVFTAIYVGAEIKAAVQSGALTSLLWILLPAAAVSLRKYVTAKRVEALRILGALSVSVSAMSVVFDAFDAAPNEEKSPLLLEILMDEAKDAAAELAALHKHCATFIFTLTENEQQTAVIAAQQLNRLKGTR